MQDIQRSSSALVAEGWEEERASPATEHGPLRVRWGMVFAVWSALAAVSLVQLILTFTVVGETAGRWPAALIQSSRWLLWAPVTPIVVWAAQRFSLVQTGARRWIAGMAHILLAVVLSIAVEGAGSFFRLLLDPVPVRELVATPGVLSRAAAQTLGGSFLGLFVYVTTIGIVTGVLAERRARDRERRHARLAVAFATAQVRAIKMQVHPHFLFNTLQAINVLIQESPARAQRMVMLLGQLLRSTLDRADSTMVTLDREIELVKLYFQIESIRFHDRLIVVYDIAPATRSALVPDLILQPLAENAIKHGIAQSEHGGTITIHSSLRDGTISIAVSNAGGTNPATTVTEGVGLATVRERLHHLYGDDAHFALELCVERAVASINLPHRTDEVQ